MQRVAELETEPEVGKFYLVPCVRHYGEWVPVIGPRHDDREVIGFAEKHYHKDVRFLSDDWLEQRWAWSRFNSSRPLTCTPEEYELASVLIVDAEPRERRMKCRRRMPQFPTAITDAGRPAWQRKLERAYKNANAKCGRCPHRGLPLNGQPVKDGKVICPGHGLVFDVATGKLVPRTS
jgi:hypothetical protein